MGMLAQRWGLKLYKLEAGAMIHIQRMTYAVKLDRLIIRLYTAVK